MDVISIKYDYHFEYLLIDNICNWLTHIRMTSSFQISFAFVIVSINQYILMIYIIQNRFSKQNNEWLYLLLSIWLGNNPVDILALKISLEKKTQIKKWCIFDSHDMIIFYL